MRFAAMLSICGLIGLASLGRAATDQNPSEEKFALSKDEKKLLELTNLERAKVGAPALQVSEKLFKAARAHSANMAKQGLLSHTLDDKGPTERLANVGYNAAGWGENCAAGQPSPEEAMKSWMASDDHRSNLVNATFVEVGLGLASDGKGGLYCTQVFAIPGKD